MAYDVWGVRGLYTSLSDGWTYLNAHDRSGTIFLITGIGYYPNLGVKDAFVLIRRRNPDGTDTQTAVHLSDAIDDDRLAGGPGR